MSKLMLWCHKMVYGQVRRTLFHVVCLSEGKTLVGHIDSHCCGDETHPLPLQCLYGTVNMSGRHLTTVTSWHCHGAVVPCGGDPWGIGREVGFLSSLEGLYVSGNEHFSQHLCSEKTLLPSCGELPERKGIGTVALWQGKATHTTYL